MFIYLHKFLKRTERNGYKQNERRSVHPQSNFERHPLVCNFAIIGTRRAQRIATGRTTAMRTIATFTSPYRHAGERNFELQKRGQKLLLLA